MSGKTIGNPVGFYELKWDTEFFGVSCAKAILYESLPLSKWNELKNRFGKYQFISIENRDSDPTNAQLIGKYTSAFLADVNIQFTKKVEFQVEKSGSITICQALERNDRLLEIAEFGFSKFTEDPELLKRGGDQVYRQWLLNAFGQPGKYFAISRDNEDKIDGFLLHSYEKDACVIELMAVLSFAARAGIGSKLFQSVESSAFQRGFAEIRVGTQVRNKAAINFYHKVGCQQVKCHQVYHLWNVS